MSAFSLFVENVFAVAPDETTSLREAIAGLALPPESFMGPVFLLTVFLVPVCLVASAVVRSGSAKSRTLRILGWWLMPPAMLVLPGLSPGEELEAVGMVVFPFFSSSKYLVLWGRSLKQWLWAVPIPENGGGSITWWCSTGSSDGGWSLVVLALLAVTLTCQ